MTNEKQRSSEENRKLDVSPLAVELIGKFMVPRNMGNQERDDEDAAIRIRRQN